jgi:hypothetical protein
MQSEAQHEEQTQLEIRKLRLEIQGLERASKLGYLITQQIPSLTALIAVGAFIFGIIQYKAQQQKDRDLRDKEFKLKYWEKQLDVYLSISQSAARLATLDNEDERDKEYQRFTELYFGNFLMIVTDDKTAHAAKTFFQKYIDYQNDPRKQVEVQLSSKDLANSCRNSLRESWDVPLKVLDISQY